MSTLSGQPAEISCTISVKRKDTGITETYDMVGHINSETVEQPHLAKEQDNGNNPQHRSA